ncbi:MAG: cytochrome c oxidase subunit II [Rhodospirillaceae bacterium]|jgi:cytochrome c oxidase subunit 2|nr:cytochrome c oxidase subunit II [Rhodospirillaceae bacterium]
MPFGRLLSALGAMLLMAVVGTGSVSAAQPRPWEMGMQPAASPVMDQMEGFHDLLLVIITVISVFVLLLLIYVMWKFNAKANPQPSRTAHNTVLEVAWTVVPILILVIVAIPSFKLLYFQDRSPDAEMTIKAIGHQWYWSYEYPDDGNFTFDSFMKYDDSLEEGEPRLLATDTKVVLPVDTDIRILVTADDVLHSWAVPAFGVKQDGVPGRVAEKWVRIEEPGVYFGQCSELCGVNHGFMPIEVHAVSKEDYKAWVAEAQEMYAKVGEPDTTVANAEAE